MRSRREDGDRPARPPRDGDRPPPRAARGDKPFKPREAGDRPFRARRDDNRPAPPEDRVDRPVRPRREDGDRPFRARADGERPAPRAPRGDRPFKPREERGERPFKPREGGDRPFRPRRDDDRPAPRADRPFRPRHEDERRSQPPARTTREKPEHVERIAKVIARAGLCSRRDAEAWIEAGRVAVNGEVLTSPALDVTKRDNIMVDGKLLPTRERTRLFLFHKPRGLVTTARDPEGRPTVFENLPPGLPRVVTIGRLDINTEGLLLLTNDGGLSRVLELPDTAWLRRYRVRAFGDVTQPALDALRDGVTIDGMHYGPVEAEVDRAQGDNVWITLGLREGKNREVKKILEHLGLQVNRLIRVSFGPFQLGDLPEGGVEEVSTRILADQLGKELAEQGAVDFEAPVFVYEDDDFRPKKPVPRERGRTGDDRPRRDDGERPPRRDRDERPPRGDDRVPRSRGGDDRVPRSRGGDRGERPRARTGRDDAPDAGDRPARPPRRHPTEPLRSIWRSDDVDPASPGRAAKVPRRGADPKAARTESAGREHVRAGKVTSRTGKSVLVERVARDPAAAPRSDAPQRSPASDRPSRSAWVDVGEAPAAASADRPERRDPPERRDRPERGDRPQREGRPFRPRTAAPSGEDRPRRAAGPRPDRFGDDRPRTERPRSGPDGGKRTFGDKPRTGAAKPSGFRDRGPSDRPAGDRPAGDRPFRGKPGGAGKPGGRPSEGGRGSSRPGGGPGGNRPGGGPGGSRPPRRPRRDD